MKTLGSVLLVSVASVFLAACATRRAPLPADTAPGATPHVATPKIEVLEELAGSSWLLEELGGQVVAEPPEGWSPRSLEFGAEGLRATGHAGVNRFGGRFEQDGARLTFGPLAMTRRAGPEDLMEGEQRYTQVLSQVVAWRQDGNRLVLLTPGERRAAVFRRVAPPAVK